jgi:hypothetical protein
MVDFINLILHVCNKPKMFFIQKIEDFYFFTSGYVAGKENQIYYDFFDEFSKYLAIKYSYREGMSYNLLIRSMSIYDEITLNILKKELIEFLQSDSINKIVFSETFSRKNLEDLLSKYFN